MTINRFFGLSSCMAMLTFLVACGDDSGSNSSNPPENAMESCTVTKNADSTSYVLKCPDGTEVEIHDGKNGENGANGSDGKNGAAGKNGASDTSAAAGAGCTLKEMDGGSMSLECPDGTKLVFGEDGKVAGKGSSSSATGTSSNSGGGSSSSAKPSGNSSSSQAATGKTQGYVQFNSDTYGSIEEVSGAGIYLFDADNQTKTAMVTVYADSPDSLQLTLDRRDLYFYGPLPMITYGKDSESELFVDSVSNLVVKYMDPSTGVAKFDSAQVSVRLSKSITCSFGTNWYYDLADKAVITYRDNRLAGSGVVMVRVHSLKIKDQSAMGTIYESLDDGRYIPLYPVAGGEPYERIGFVGFTVGEPGDGEVKVEDGAKVEAICDIIHNNYGTQVNSASATWYKSQFFGMTCEPGKVLSGEVYPDRRYVCEDGFFRAATDIETDLGKTYVGTCPNDGGLLTGMSGKKYACGDGVLRAATNIELDLGTAYAGLCPNDGSLLTGTSGKKYACGDGVLRAATNIELDLGTAYAGLCPNDGSLLTGTSGKKYACGEGSFRAANESEVSVGKGCTTNNLNVKYGDYACTSVGGWTFDPAKVQKGSFVDSRDNKTYKTVKIGSQTWMAENLNYETANSYCYNDDTSNCTKYGRLYLWSAAMDSAGTWSSNGKGCGYGKSCLPTYPVRGACPSGWHLPDSLEFKALFTAVGGNDVAGESLKSATGWVSDGNGIDVYSFSALPAGDRENGRFESGGNSASFWSSTEYNSNYYAYRMSLFYDLDRAGLGNRDKLYGYSVRCLKD